MSVYRTDEIYEQLSLLRQERESYDGSKSFGWRDEAKLAAIHEEESALLAELEQMRREGRWYEKSSTA